MSWLINACYVLLLIAVSPILLYRIVRMGKYREGWQQKLLGRLPLRENDRPRVWFHAVSVGEVLLLDGLIQQLIRQSPDVDILISTTTSTGQAVAKTRFPKHQVCYFPLDFSWSVAAAIARVQSSAIVLVELELWPNFIRSAARRQVPLLLINGRIGERSFRGYRRIRPLMSRLLAKFQTLAVQNETYADRLRQLGAPDERIHVTGSIKFDNLQTDRRNSRTLAIREWFGLRDNEVVWIAGSTQDPEEAIVLDCYAKLRVEHPELRLIIVPRHKERFDEVARLIEQKGHVTTRRSTTAANATGANATQSHRQAPVCLLDTLGELSDCWGLADIAFVGGSLTQRGGQNMIEPAAYGAAVLFGPNTWNFRDAVDGLLANHAANVVRNADEMCETVQHLIEQPHERMRVGAKAQRFVTEQQGATAETVQLITAAIGTSRRRRLAA
ncbi:MAG: 3-deoxy-D-manno-octulosonic acid transferase [Planctomycetota bacterium]|nr:3-deoxy-D-manno-octulosonic acid transferase [Planctomycetota bacterium]